MIRVEVLRGIAWIAGNDDPSELGLETVAGTVSVGLLADLAERSPRWIAGRVVALRLKWAGKDSE